MTVGILHGRGSGNAGRKEVRLLRAGEFKLEGGSADFVSTFRFSPRSGTTSLGLNPEMMQSRARSPHQRAKWDGVSHRFSPTPLSP